VVLGKTFYRGKGVTIDADGASSLSEAFVKAFSVKTESDKRDFFLNTAFQWTYKGELYENSPENVGNFYESLRTYMIKSGLFKEDKIELKGAS
jgi:hypothetical protein